MLYAEDIFTEMNVGLNLYSVMDSTGAVVKDFVCPAAINFPFSKVTSLAVQSRGRVLYSMTGLYEVHIGYGTDYLLEARRSLMAYWNSLFR